MTAYLIDTTTLIDRSKNVEPTRSRLLAAIARGDRIATCDVIVAEFYTGVTERERATWDAFFGEMEYWAITADVAMQAGAYRRAFRARGVAIHTPDALIAALVAEYGAVLVTENPRDFPMPGLLLESWRIAGRGASNARGAEVRAAVLEAAG